ncbi:MAG: hypothetical protein MJB14_18860 [Spirochaetes bacterium]|nr:hypothetical protein [Spirochaetota bacterium]
MDKVFEIKTPTWRDSLIIAFSTQTSKDKAEQIYNWIPNDVYERIFNNKDKLLQDLISEVSIEQEVAQFVIRQLESILDFLEEEASYSELSL